MKIKVTHTQIIDKLTEKGPCKEYILEGEPVNEHEELCSYKGTDTPCSCLKEPKKVIEEIGVSFTMVTLRDKTNELVKAFNNLKI